MRKFKERLSKHYDELKWLYCELYQGNTEMFESLCYNMEQWYVQRKPYLKAMDAEREKNPRWYHGNDLIGMMMYTDAFADNLSGIRKNLDYIKECQVNYLHLMPLLDSPKGKSDGGYAVSDFRTVRKDLGTMEELSELAEECHKDGISLCLDFVMNHTSEEHEWAKRARAGEWEYQNRYFFYDNYDIPYQYEQTVPQVFPTTAPGNFTWLEDMHKFVMTSFYPYQWDLNYANPVVFNEMVYNMLNLTNQGIDIVRIDAVPYIWKQLGTNCRNLPQVHSIVRMMRMISEIVCPGVILLGEVVMEPVKVVPYFGSIEKPECHMLYNVTTMATIWHSIATQNIQLLKYQMDVINKLPREYVFLNYLRCHDDIGWGLDYAFLAQTQGISETVHKQYLSEYFTGIFPGSPAKGQLYNADPVSGDARQCGTTASLCGIEKSNYECDDILLERSIQCDIMLHAYMMTLSGIPIIYSGDEIGQINDYTYRRSDDPDRAADSRYLHRGHFKWDLAKKRHDTSTIGGRIFTALGKLEEIHRNHRVFSSDAEVWTLETYDDSILCIGRYYDNEKLIAVFNFSSDYRTAWIHEDDEEYTELMTGTKMAPKELGLTPYGMFLLHKKY